MVTEDEIRSAMKQVEDPELGVNIVDLGLLYGVDVGDDGHVTLDMTLTSMGCPLTEQILGDSRAALEPLEGVTGVDVNWVWDPPWSPDVDDRGGALPHEGHGLWLSRPRRSATARSPSRRRRPPPAPAPRRPARPRRSARPS